jgi:hypothetical protein
MTTAVTTKPETTSLIHVMPKRLRQLITSKTTFNLLLWILVILAICMLMKVYYLAIDISQLLSEKNTVYYFNNPSLDKFIRELDVAGLLGGIIGILFSVYITIIVEENNEIKEIEAEERRSEASLFDNRMRQIVIEAEEKRKNFLASEDIRSTIETIANVLDKAVEHNQNIYVMSHSQLIPKMMEYRVHTIADFGNIDVSDLKKMTYHDYHVKYTEYKNSIEALHNKFISAARKLKNSSLPRSINYVTIDPDGAYIQNYIDPVLKGSTVIFYKKESDDVVANFQNISDIKDLDGLYLIPLTRGGDTQEERIEIFKQYLIDKHKEVNSLFSIINTKESNNLKIVQQVTQDVYLNEIHDGGSDDGSCVFFLTNKHTLSHSARKLLSFEVRREKYVTDSFIKIINSTQ